MDNVEANRQRQAQKPIAYLIIFALCALIALGAAWEVAQVTGTAQPTDSLR
jgi:hypothetical protein